MNHTSLADPVTGELYEKESEFVNQIALLRLDTLVWHEVRCKKGRKMESCLPDLFNFSSDLINDRILIFGGMLGTYA